MTTAVTMIAATTITITKATMRTVMRWIMMTRTNYGFTHVVLCPTMNGRACRLALSTAFFGRGHRVTDD